MKSTAIESLTLPFPPDFPLNGLSAHHELKSCLDPEGFSVEEFQTLRQRYFRYWMPYRAWNEDSHSFLCDYREQICLRIPVSACFKAFAPEQCEDDLVRQSLLRCRQTTRQILQNPGPLTPYTPLLPREKPCKTCEGTGALCICPTCQGRGDVLLPGQNVPTACENCGSAGTERGYLRLSEIQHREDFLRLSLKDLQENTCECFACFGSSYEELLVPYRGFGISSLLLKSLRVPTLYLGVLRPFPPAAEGRAYLYFRAASKIEGVLIARAL